MKFVSDALSWPELILYCPDLSLMTAKTFQCCITYRIGLFSCSQWQLGARCLRPHKGTEFVAVSWRLLPVRQQLRGYPRNLLKRTSISTSSSIDMAGKCPLQKQSSFFIIIYNMMLCVCDAVKLFIYRHYQGRSYEKESVQPFLISCRSEPNWCLQLTYIHRGNRRVWDQFIHGGIESNWCSRCRCSKTRPLTI